MKTTECIDVETLFAVHPFARTILDTLQEGGHSAFLIGGVVRDGVLRSWGEDVPYPPEDIDIATSALPDEIREVFPSRRILGVGEEFGVVLVVSPNGRPYEVATFRVEEEYDGRWPSKVDLVRDLAADVKRRDLTINGLAATRDGCVVDLVDGIPDLQCRKVRAIGDPEKRFAEDYLRMLRAVRFACQIDGHLEPSTETAIRLHAERIRRISHERVRDELLRMLETKRSAKGIEWLDRLGLLEHVLPEIVELQGVPQPEEYHPEGDVFVHTVAALRQADTFVDDPIVKLAVLLHDVGKPQALARNRGMNMGGHCAVGAGIAQRAAQRLRLSRGEIARIVFLVKNHMRIADFPMMGRGKQVRFLTEGSCADQEALSRRYPLFFDLLKLLVVDCEASAHHAAGWSPVLRETLRVIDHIERVGDLKRARSLIDGHDLLSLGLSPGPHLGALLEQLHDECLAGELRTREDALARAEALITQSLGREGETRGTCGLDHHSQSL